MPVIPNLLNPIDIINIGGDDAYTVTGKDNGRTINVDTSSGAATVLFTNSAIALGSVVRVKDIAGEANLYPVTLLGIINDEPGIGTSIKTAYGSAVIEFTGSGWLLTSKTYDVYDVTSLANSVSEFKIPPFITQPINLSLYRLAQGISLGDIWTTTGNLNTVRTSLSGAGTQNAALSFGGNTGGISAITEKFNGSTWTTTGSLNTARNGLAGSGTQNAALSFGGSTGTVSAVTEKFNGITWTATGNLLTARNGLAGSGTQNAALSFGGAASGSLAVTEKFTGPTSKDTSIISMNATDKITSGTSYPAGSDIVVDVVTNPYTGDATEFAHLTELDKLSIQVWTATGSLNTARSGLAGSGTQNAALCFGGSGPLATTEKFNGATWSSTGSLNTARYGLAGSGTQNAALSFGGAAPSASAITEKFNGSTWSSSGDLVTARYALAGSGTQNAALSFGGFTTISVVANTEKFTNMAAPYTDNDYILRSTEKLIKVY